MTAKHVVACCLVLAWAGVAVIGQDAAPKPAPMSKEALNEDQLAVYRAVLAGSTDEHMPQVNLAERTVLLDATVHYSGNAECGKGMDLEEMPTEVHQLKTADFAQMGKVRIRLVEPDRGRRDAANNDPGQAIRGGTPVDTAVENGYAHGLFTLSEIRFDEEAPACDSCVQF